MTGIPFFKYHGLGNDFVLMNSTDVPGGQKLNQLASQCCDRHRGIGADGLILYHPSQNPQARARMQIINADGSEPEMCGNGLRTFAHYLHQQHNFEERFLVETAAGVLTCELSDTTPQRTQVRVDMGVPRLAQHDIPATGFSASPVINETLEVTESGDTRTFEVSLVSMGNPHCIVKVEQIPEDWHRWGKALMVHPRFPKQINVEFSVFHSPQEVEVKVWERGVGPTEACGTGACAVAVAGQLMGLLEPTSQVHLPGGPLDIAWNGINQTVYMTGPSVAVYSGIYAIPQVKQ